MTSLPRWQERARYGLISCLLLAAGSCRPAALHAKEPRAAARIEVAEHVPALPREPRADLASLDGLIRDAMAAWQVPGLAVAAVKDGKIVFERVYGYRDRERRLPVTTKTLFGIGSMTKSMTAAALGTLVDEGKLDWDTPVARYLPGFRLYDDYRTEHATVRDLASHRTGVPDHWFLWYGADHLTRSELLDRLRYLEPNHELRTTFEYNTLMYVALGEMGARVAGLPDAETFVRDRLWAPLGMTQSNFSVRATQASADFATPYRRLDGAVVPTVFHDQDVVGPAGAVNSTIEDMARYIAFQANVGSLAGKTIVSDVTMREIQRPMTTRIGPSEHPELGEQTYCLGLYSRTYRGHRMVTHSGGIDGVGAHFAALPDDHIGVVVLNNLSFGASMLPVVLSQVILDRLLGLAPIDWQKTLFEWSSAGWKAEDEAAERPTRRREGTNPSHPLEEFAGDFDNPAYGTAHVDVEGGTLRLVFHGSHPLTHVHYDVFEVAHDRKDDFDRMRLAFETDAAGDIASFSMPLEPETRPIVFARGPNRAMMNVKALLPLVGDYDMGGWTLRVVTRGPTAIAAVGPDGTATRLTPVRGTTFAMPDGDTIVFSAAGLVIHATGGDFRGSKVPLK
jgi:CubicO group peptidase (beta-lactamase class C family)